MHAATYPGLALVQHGEVFHYHTDHIGKPREITNARAKVVWSSTFKTYGALALAHVNVPSLLWCNCHGRLACLDAVQSGIKICMESETNLWFIPPKSSTRSHRCFSPVGC